MTASPPPVIAGPEGRLRLALAQRVADMHRGIDDDSLMAVVSGSTAEDIADARSDIDMCIAFEALPEEDVLRVACRRAGGDWFWHQGDRQNGIVVSFHAEGIEVQIGYCSHAWLAGKLDDILVQHNPDTPYHKVAEGMLKAVPLAGAERVAAWQQRLADFPPALGRAMVVRGLLGPISWRGISQLLHRDAALTCRDIQVDACYRLLLMLCGLNGLYFTRFQFKRLQRLASKLTLAPPRLAERIDALLLAPAQEAFAALHVLEGEVLDRVAQAMPDVDLAEARKRRERWLPD
jgi:hypothetical protein